MVDVEVEVGGGCWWESRGEESAYEVVAALQRDREREREQSGRRGSKRRAFR